MITTGVRSALGAVGGLAVGLVLAGCSGPAPLMTSDEVAAVVADPGSTPEQVVTAYIAALQEHDADAVHALVGPPGEQMADAWLADTPTIGSVTVSPAVPDSTTGSAAEGYRTAVYVPVQFSLHGGDGTMQQGANGWGYLLARNADSDPWRIVDNGVG